MISLTKKAICLSLVTLFSLAPCTEQERGWFFYKDDIVPEKTKKRTHSIPTTPQEAVLEMSALREDLESKRFLAILNPTIDNLKSFLEAQHSNLKKADKFADIWTKSITHNPQLDPTIKKPSSYSASLIEKSIRREQDSKIFAKKIEDNHFLFFYTSSCRYCDLMYGTLKSIRNIKIIPVSIDGVKKYPNSISYSQLGIELPINVTPYIWALDSKQNLVPICAGAKDLEQLQTHILKMLDN